MVPVNKYYPKPLTASDAPNALTERIKELNCLYGISNLFENQDVSLSWIMQRAVELIPAAWQYPENACARIKLDGQEYISANFKESCWCQSTDIILNSNLVGNVDVYYIQEPPESNDGPFIEEEARLLRAIGERLSKVLWLKRYEEAIKESEERYRVLTEQVDEGVALVQNGRFYYVNPAFCKMFNLHSPAAINNCFVHAPPVENADEISRLYGSKVESISNKESIIEYSDLNSVEQIDNSRSDRVHNTKVHDLHIANKAGEVPLARAYEVHSFDRSDKRLWVQACHSPITFKGSPALLSTFKDITEIKEEQMAVQHMADLLNNENRMLRSSLKERYRLGDIFGHSQAMQAVYELILKAATTDANVAVFGESGSGKELVAQAIHNYSLRKKRRFVAVNCGAIQESLFEREFFGHRKGAFSSAHADSSGYLDMADKGTLFLDEISELTVNMQAKLLRAIEGGEYRPVGSTETVSSDFRIISASNVSLTDKVASGCMRTDFFYRIQVIQIQLPPLRNRKQDIPLLVEHLLRKIDAKSEILRVPGRIMDTLIEYDWPGNVRELRNVLQRYITLGNIEFLSPNQESPISLMPPKDLNLRQAVEHIENTLIRNALEQTGGNRTQAAGLLGISRRALFRKMVSL